MIRILQNGYLNQGKYAIKWDARDENGLPAPTGIYFLKAISGDQIQVKKIFLIK